MARQPPDPKPAPPLSFALAVRMAREYFDLGVRQYKLMADPVHVMEGSKGGLAGLSTQATERAIAAATVLSSAVELSLKCVIAQRKGIFPQEPSIEALVAYLPDPVRQQVAKRYEDLRASNPNYLSFEMALGADLIGTPVNGDGFDATAENIANLFIKLRYLHEDFANGFAYRIDFHWLILMCQVLTDELMQYKGAIVIKYGEQSVQRIPVP